MHVTNMIYRFLPLLLLVITWTKATFNESYSLEAIQHMTEKIESVTISTLNLITLTVNVAVGISNECCYARCVQVSDDDTFTCAEIELKSTDELSNSMNFDIEPFNYMVIIGRNNEQLFRSEIIHIVGSYIKFSNEGVSAMRQLISPPTYDIVGCDLVKVQVEISKPGLYFFVKQLDDGTFINIACESFGSHEVPGSLSYPDIPAQSTILMVGLTDGDGEGEWIRSETSTFSELDVNAMPIEITRPKITNYDILKQEVKLFFQISQPGLYQFLRKHQDGTFYNIGADSLDAAEVPDIFIHNAIPKKSEIVLVGKIVGAQSDIRWIRSRVVELEPIVNVVVTGFVVFFVCIFGCCWFCCRSKKTKVNGMHMTQTSRVKQGGGVTGISRSHV